MLNLYTNRITPIVYGDAPLRRPAHQPVAERERPRFLRIPGRRGQAAQRDRAARR